MFGEESVCHVVEALEGGQVIGDYSGVVTVSSGGYHRAILEGIAPNAGVLCVEFVHYDGEKEGG